MTDKLMEELYSGVAAYMYATADRCNQQNGYLCKNIDTPCVWKYTDGGFCFCKITPINEILKRS
jgi:hypothetical protein